MTANPLSRRIKSWVLTAFLTGLLAVLVALELYWARGVFVEFTVVSQSSNFGYAYPIARVGGQFYDKNHTSFEIAPGENRIRCFLRARRGVSQIGFRFPVMDGDVALTPTRILVRGAGRAHAAWNDTAAFTLERDGAMRSPAMYHVLKARSRFSILQIVAIWCLVALAGCGFFFASCRLFAGNVRFVVRDWLTLGLVLGAFFVPAWFPTRASRSLLESRRLSPFPDFKRIFDSNYAFGKAFDDWFTDRFGLRQEAITAYYAMRLRGNDRVLYGPDGWLFGTLFNTEKMAQNANLFTDAEMDALSANMQRFVARALEAGVKKVYLTFCSDKESIYPEIYPSRRAKLNPRSRLDLVCERLVRDLKTAEVIRMTSQQLEIKKTHDTFCRSGTHMTSYAVFRTYQHLASCIHRDFPDFRVLNDADCVFTRAKAFTDTDLIKIGHVPFYPSKYLMNDVVSIRQPRAVKTLERKRTKPWIQYVAFSANAKCGNKLKLFLITDSFGKAWSPYLSEGVSSLGYVFTGFDDPFDIHPLDQAVILKMKPDILVVNMTERFLHRLLSLRFPGDNGGKEKSK